MADENAVQVAVQAVIGDFLHSMEQVTGAIKGIAGPLGEISGIAKEAGEAMAAAFAIEKIIQFDEAMEQLGVKIARAQALLGASAGTVATLEVAAKAAGGSLEGMEKAVERLGLNLARADAGSGQARAALEALGLEAKSFSALDTEAKLAKLAEKFSVLKDGTDKDAIAMALLGRAGAEMIPVFNQGAEAMEHFHEIVKRAGSEATPQFQEAVHGLHMQTIELEQSMQGLGIAVLTEVAPAFAGIKQILIDWVQAMKDSVTQGGVMYAVIFQLRVEVQALATAFAVAIAATRLMYTIIVELIKGMAEQFLNLGRIIKDAFTLNFKDLQVAVNNAMELFRNRVKTTTGDVEKIFSDTVNEIKKTWGIGAEEVHKIEQNKNAKLALINKDAIALAQEAAAARIKQAELEYQITTDKIKNTYGTFFFTEGAKTAALLQALEVRKAAQNGAIEDELKVLKQGTVQYAKALDEKKALDLKYTLDRQKILEQAAKDEEKMWKDGLTIVTSSFNSQLRGLLAGTTSWKQAMNAILGDMVIKAIEGFEKMAVQWVAHELVQTAATEAGVTARTSASVAGDAITLTSQISKVLSSIWASVAETFAGVTGFLASVMGPYAPIAGAGVAAGVAATALSMGKFDVGTDMVMKTGLALIHQGETIIPAAQGSGPFTGEASAGSSQRSVAFHISTLDGPSFAQWLRGGGGDQIAKHVAHAFNTSPSMRPRF